MERTEERSEAEIDPTTLSHNLFMKVNWIILMIIMLITTNNDNDDDDDHNNTYNTHLTDALILSSSDDKSSQKNDADNNFVFWIPLILISQYQQGK